MDRQWGAEPRGRIGAAPVAFGAESVADIVPSWRLLAAFAYLVFLVSVFAYLLWFRILAVSGATAAVRTTS